MTQQGDSMQIVEKIRYRNLRDDDIVIDRYGRKWSVVNPHFGSGAPGASGVSGYTRFDLRPIPDAVPDERKPFIDVCQPTGNFVRRWRLATQSEINRHVAELLAPKEGDNRE
jgi:hypothetical protein